MHAYRAHQLHVDNVKLTLALALPQVVEQRMAHLNEMLEYHGTSTPFAVFLDTHATETGMVTFETPSPVLRKLAFVPEKIEASGIYVPAVSPRLP